MTDSPAAPRPLAGHRPPAGRRPPAAPRRPAGVLSRLPVAEPTVEQRWAESRGPLVERLRDGILADGPITFATFMRAALYDPADGYYVTRADRTTRAGDFLTAPEMDPIFGAALAAHLEDGWMRLGAPPRFTWRDDGAGSGALALAVLTELRRRGSPLLAALRYRPVEAQPAREVAIRASVAAEGFGATLEALPEATLEALPEATLEALPGPATDGIIGVITANELLDALPVHRVTRRGGDLLELYVAWRDGWFVDEPGRPSDAALEGTLAASRVALGEDQVAEVSLAAQAWLRGAATELARGWMLLIDYGGEGRELWGAAHPEGLLRTYRTHHAGADPYRAVGRQDLTAHVDMTAVRRTVVAAGLDLVGQTTQAEFLADLGVGELLVEVGHDPATTAPRYRTARGALMRLLDPGAMGRFAVLAAGRGLPAEPPLRGFGFQLPRG